MKKVTIVMYHYIRELPYTRYPEIKGLLLSQFKEQIGYLKKYYRFVTVEECIDACYSSGGGVHYSFPANAVLLTFDDGYADHFTNVFPILEENNIQGCFFPPAKTVLENKVLGVNKIHFLLATISNTEGLLQDIYDCLNRYRSKHSLESNEYYFAKLAQASRFDSKEVIFIKRLLQAELDEVVRNLIVDELFSKHVTRDETAFARELYMSVDQLKCMVRNGMYIGSHGYDHFWLDRLSPVEQARDVDLSIKFLEQIGSPTDRWVMCYPYGAYNNSLIEHLNKKGCKLGLTTKVDIAHLSRDNAFTLERLDTNDLPKMVSAELNVWTKKQRSW